MPHYFTVEEANSALRVVRPLVGQLIQIRQEIQARQPELLPLLERLAGNGGGEIPSHLTGLFLRMEKLVEQINATGAVLKDISQGLVDFPALRDGREIYLCWRCGEDTIAYWHELDTGFAGRERL